MSSHIAETTASLESQVRVLSQLVQSLKENVKTQSCCVCGGVVAAAGQTETFALTDRTQIVDLQREVETLRQWKASASTTIQHLQQRLRREVLIPDVKHQVSGCGEGGAVDEEVSGLDDNSKPLPTNNTNPQNPDPQPAQLAALIVDLRAELDKCKRRNRCLEEELTITRARWTVAEMQSGRQPWTQQPLSGADSARLRVSTLLSKPTAELHSVLVEAAVLLRDALTRHGAIALPIVPQANLETSILALALRDHCKMAAKRLLAIESTPHRN